MFAPARFPHVMYRVAAKPTDICHLPYIVPGVMVYNTSYDWETGFREWKKDWAEPNHTDVYVPVTGISFVEKWLHHNNLEFTKKENLYGHPGNLPQTKEAKARYEQIGRDAIAACPSIQDRWTELFCPYQAELSGLVVSGWRYLLLHWIGGSGKTLAAIVAGELVEGPKVYLVPSGVRPGWAKESNAAVADLVEEATGQKAFMCMPKSMNVGPEKLVAYIEDCEREGRTIRIVVGHEYLSYWAEIIKSTKPAVLIVDEVDVIASEKTKKVSIDKTGKTQFSKQRSEKTGRKKRGVSAQELAELESIKLILGLTATPFDKMGPEAFWPAAHMTMPYSFGGGSFQYKVRYCGAVKEQYGWKTKKATNYNELKWRTVPFMHRVTYEEALADLPPISYGLLVVRKEDRQKSNLRYNEQLTWNQAIRQSAKDPNLPPANELRRAYTSELSRQVVVQRAVEEAVSGGRVLIFVDRLVQAAEWRKALETGLKKKVDKHVAKPGLYMITGDDVTPEQKYKVIEQYNSDPNGAICVATVQAAGRGVDGFQQTTLSICTLILSPKTFEQMRFRTDRKGRKVRTRLEVVMVEDTHMESQLRDLKKGIKFYADFTDSESFKTVATALEENEATTEDAIDSLLSFCF